ncbi:uncharacterized protein KNAG_0B00680 [Huiozyma naganishii CBS 8797]|uniref:Ketoreductase (KR) domain-containing protein n=1 Tax=Huiozyma naganishii (strain ATCC MYA-139 / BCRC 22969 / CBS 8797 / KCTC 17520 / NBRC 10181 / NCYC 3082 / Yp74L-3) TaxID=1071383 RepID=J7S4E7_HUIN7|nr:hypothetical protein KNAG_0B00680 [Kazachstania naganishii CBS 8797]CCK68516.1 hypothetical protein KNAG_0B00680 [Kazachstania naganishii CBS 8797]
MSTTSAPAYSKLKMLYELYYGFFPNKPTFTPEDYPDLAGKTAVVTGCNTGIGLHVVEYLYKKNCNVIGVVRTESKGIAARDKIVKECPESKGSISIVGGCDFCDLSLIKDTGVKVKEILGDKPLSIIIHNAGLMASSNQLTSKQGYELMFQTNCLGPQLLQHFLDSLFLKKDSDLKRIVWVSSGAHLLGFKDYGINWEDPCFEKVSKNQRAHAAVLYGQSKTGNIYQANAWASKHKEIVEEIGCVSVSCYPGNLKTDLQRDWSRIGRWIGNRIFWDGNYGAYSELYGALYPGLSTKDQGVYIVPFGEIHDPREDVKAGLSNGTDLKFWDIVEEKISPFF